MSPQLKRCTIVHMAEHYHIWIQNELVTGKVAAYRADEAFKHRTQANRVVKRENSSARMMVMRCDGFKCPEAVPPDPRKCRSCGHISIAKDSDGREIAGGAHVNNTGICWFCWIETPEGAAHKATRTEE